MRLILDQLTEPLRRTALFASAGLFCGLLLASWPEQLVAQANPDSIHWRNQCRKAIRVIETGHPAPHESWAVDYIASCGASGARAIATAMDNLRASADTALLNQLTQPTRRLHDATVFHAAMEIAADASASVPARVFSLRSLLYFVAPNQDPAYDELLAATPEGLPRSCGVGRFVTHSIPEVGVPLPSDFRARMQNLAGTLVQDSAVPLDVRAAALCVKSLAQP